MAASLAIAITQWEPAINNRIWLKIVIRGFLTVACIFFLGVLVQRLGENGWGDFFAITNGKQDLAPLALILVLLGATWGKRGLRLAVQSLLVAIVFYFLSRAIHEDWSGIQSRDWRFEYQWLAASLIFLGGAYAGHASGWLLILWRFHHRVPYLPGFYVWSKSLLARYVPGNVLMVVGRMVMIEPYGVPKRISLTSIAYEQALMVGSAATVLSIALPFWGTLRDKSPLIWLVMLVPPLMIIGMHPAIMGTLGNAVLKRAGREPIEKFLHFWSVIFLFLYYCFFWLIAGLGLFAMVQAVTDVSLDTIPIFIATVPLAWLVSVFFFIFPGGLGVREGVYGVTLTFAFNNEEGVASAFALLARFWQTLIEIVFVLLVMGLVKIRHQRPSTLPDG